MMRVNTARDQITTHEGAPARHISPLQQLRRSVMACLLWENTFYESGEDIATRIRTLVPQVDPLDIAAMAIEARGPMRLRHAPLMLARELARHPRRKEVRVADTIAGVIQRADELAEFLAMYWLDGKQPLTRQVKLGLAKAFTKFDAYQLAKHNRDNAIKSRDVLFLCHAKPKDKAQAKTWKKLVDGTLEAPDTWEVALSGGADKREAFERLIREDKLGYMALLRNLRNMDEAGCDDALVKGAIVEKATRSKALPFRFISAVKAAPKYLAELDQAMQQAMSGLDTLPGRTIICVDVSGSMQAPLSGRSQLNRQEAAAGLAILVNGIGQDCRVIGFGTEARELPAYKGLALANALEGLGSEVGWGTNVSAAVSMAGEIGYDRLVVITDEQSATRLQNPAERGYMINVAAYQNGIGYAPWVHIDGFSDNTVRFIAEYEGS